MGCNCTKEGIPDEEGRDVVSMSNRSASSPEHHKGDGLGMDQKSKQMKEMALENLSIEPGDSDSKGLPKHHVAKPAVPGGHANSKYPGSPLHGAVSSPVWGPGMGDPKSDTGRMQSRENMSGRLNPRIPGEFHYEGNKKGNIRDGHGVQTYPDGSKYEGEFKKNKFHGRGKLTTATGDWYDGEWKTNQMDGYGTLFLQNGSVFVGMWKDSKKHGFGKESWDDGASYEGEFSNNNRHGQGNYIFSGGEVYSGGWQNNEINGWGTLDGRGGTIYQGEWKNNKFHGSGTLHLRDGARYEGVFAQGLQDGYGVMYYFDGSVYKGGWKQGLKHGLGNMTNVKNPKLNKEGYWQEDIFTREVENSENQQSADPGNSIRPI